MIRKHMSSEVQSYIPRSGIGAIGTVTIKSTSSMTSQVHSVEAHLSVIACRQRTSAVPSERSQKRMSSSASLSESRDSPDRCARQIPIKSSRSIDVQGTLDGARLPGIRILSPPPESADHPHATLLGAGERLPRLVF